MKRKLILLSIVTLHFALPSLCLAQTKMDAFIRHLRSNTSFVQVPDIWLPDNNLDKADLLKTVTRVQPLVLDHAQIAAFMKQKNTAIDLVIPALNGGTITINLGRYEFLSNDFEVHAKGAANSYELFDYTPGLYYRGIVNGIPGSLASFSFFENEAYGLFSIPGEGNYVLAPYARPGDAPGNEHYILYADRDLKVNKYPGCGTDDLPFAKEPAAKTTTFLDNKVYNNCKVLRVFEVADYDLYLQKGSSVTNVVNYVTALFNSQSTMFKNEGVPTVLKYLQVNTVSDEYQAIATAERNKFLRLFGGVTQSTLHGCDVALLLSTRYGNMGGIAWLMATCRAYSSTDSSGAYGFANLQNVPPTSFPLFSANMYILVHELGHMTGSPHTHACCWNPPARITAIDGCAIPEGFCSPPTPIAPADGGTIMSYCGSYGGGIAFHKGFGPQPGDTVRWYLKGRFALAGCGEAYNPSTTLSLANNIVSANSECTDISGVDTTTYYWYDGYTTDHADDILVLKIKKHGNNIGNLDSAGFSVTMANTMFYGSGTGDTMSFPTGTMGLLGKNIAMRRYWSITPTKEPLTQVEVLFPFTSTDTADVNGSVPGPAVLTNYKMYKAKAPINPDPSIDSVRYGAVPDVATYSYGSAPSATTWSLSTVGSTSFAHMMIKNLAGGGSGFYTYKSVSVTDVNATGGIVRTYPNPVEGQWYVSVAQNNDLPLVLSVFSADGKAVLTSTLQNNALNKINVTNLAMGIYYYRIVSGDEVYTGTITKWRN